MARLALVRVRVTPNYGAKEFGEDIKRAALAAGTEAKHVVFLLKEAQVRDELYFDLLASLTHSVSYPYPCANPLTCSSLTI